MFKSIHLFSPTSSRYWKWRTGTWIGKRKGVAEWGREDGCTYIVVRMRRMVCERLEEKNKGVWFKLILPLPPPPSHFITPCTVAITLRRCLPLRNSRNQIPCQVPSARLPSVMGTLTEAPIRDDLICACGLLKMGRMWC